MAWKKRKKQNNIKAKVIDVEARVIPDVEETLMEEEPIISETEELKLNQAIVTDILKESAEQSFKDAWEANETVTENTEPVVEEVRETVTETADNAETTFEKVMKTVEDTAEEISNTKPEVIDVEETLREEPRLTETEELKLNQSIVSDILKESVEQNLEVAEESVETVAENAETVAEEVMETNEDTAEDISNEVSLKPAEEESFREETAEIPVVAPVEEISEETENAVTEEVQEETAGETAEPAEQTAETSEEYTDETIVYDGAGSLTIADPGETREVSTFDGDSVEKSDSMAKGKKEKKAKKVKVKKDRLGFNWFFWLSFIVLMVPVCFFLYLLYSAAQETHTPIVGERINTEIIHMIDEDQKSAVESRLKQLDGVEGCAVNLIVETMRIELDVRDDMTSEEMNDLVLQAYEAVNEILPVETYFTQQEDYKQYDLEIYAYDDMKLDEFRLILINKNSKMDTYLVQTLSDPKNAEIAAELKELREQQIIEREEEERAKAEGENAEGEETEGETEGQTEGEEATEPNEYNHAADDTTE